MNTEQNRTPSTAASPGFSAAVAMHIGRPEDHSVVEGSSRNSARVGFEDDES